MSKKAQELAKLMAEHPDLDVVFMVDGNEVLFDHARTAHRAEACYVGYIAECDDEYHVSATMKGLEDALKDVFMSKHCFPQHVTNSEVEEFLREFKFNPFIIVETGAM